MVPPRVPNPPEIGRASCRERAKRAVGVATVERNGVACVTTRVSAGSLQAVVIGAWLQTTSWCDWSRDVRASVRVNGSEVAVPVPPPELTTALVLVKIAALPQVASFGP